MRKLFIALAVLFVSATAFAAEWNLQGNTYTAKTVFHAQVGPGTTQTSVELSGPSEMKVFYTTTDLTNPYVEMRGVMANNKVASVATVPAMATANNAEGQLYFAGVNADFFGNNAPIGTTVIDSEIYFAPVANGWSHFAIDADAKPYLGVADFSGSVTKADGTSIALTAVNTGRGAEYLVIYTPKFGATTGTNAYGNEVTLTPIDGPIAAGNTVKMKVSCAPASAGSMAIPAGGYVLSGHGAASTFVQSLANGEEITVSTTIKFGETSVAPTQILGGCPMILSGGQVLETQTALDHLTALNPRTAVGYDATGTKLVMLVVDGRSAISAGCVSKVLADIMREVGCTEAMNFDGGGSTTLYVDAFGTVNAPSGGALRAVTNGLYAVATAPTDNTIASIAFREPDITLPKYGFYTPTIYGYNKYGVLISTKVEGVTLSCPAELGEVTDGGSTLFANGAGTHTLTATINGITATIEATVSTTNSAEFKYTDVLIDNYREWPVEVQALVNGEYMPLSSKALAWATADASVASVSDEGVVKGQKDGKTTISGSVGDFSGAVNITVECPTGATMPIEKTLNADAWTAAMSVVGVSNNSVTALNESGMSINYTVASGRSRSITLNRNDVKVWSLPDALKFAINPGSATIKTFTLSYRAANGTAKSYTVPSVPANTETIVEIPVSDFADVNDIGIYPISFTGMNIVLGTATAGNTHSIQLSKLEGVYNNYSAGVDDVIADNGSDITLSPNPVNAGDAVAISAEAEYAVYSINGRLMTQGAGSQISTKALTTGLYIVKIKTENGESAARLIVK